MARIVLVHGAFGGSWCWETVLPGLRDGGHAVEAIDLPGAGQDPTPAYAVSLALYGERICRAAQGREPAVLIGQSMGGVAITQAAASCPRQVAALIFVSAFAPGEGQSLMDLTAYPEAAGDQVQANIVVAGDPPVATMPAAAAREAIYNCASAERAAWAAARLGPQAVAPFTQPVSVEDAHRAAFEQLPRAYIGCTQDRAIAPPLQRRMALDVGCPEVVELDADHSPWLSCPHELILALERVIARIAPSTGASNRPERDSADRQEALRGMAGRGRAHRLGCDRCPGGAPRRGER
jgi:pimeloyl-ACP methyl ester carboxylesterase